MPNRLGEIGRRLWYFLNRSRFERQLRDEMDAHRAEKETSGRRGPRFGNSLRLREEAADEWGWAWFDRLSQDLRFAVRLLRRAPVFTATAMAVLAVGVGLNLAAFQVFDAVALSPLPVRSPDALVKLERRNGRGHSTTFSYPAFDFYRSKSASISSAMALVSGTVTLGDDASHPVAAEFVSSIYFADLGVQPVAGRLLDAGDDGAAAPVILLGESLWKARFGGDPGTIGRTLRVNGRPFTLAGIVPESFLGLDHHDAAAWIPVTQHGLAFAGSRMIENWEDHSVQFYARLRDGVTRPAAEAELAGIAKALAPLRRDSGWADEWVPIRSAGTYAPLDGMNPAALVLSGSLVMLVFVSACMNLGLLVLARSLGRGREFAIRLSVGASRGRILRQLLTEHFVLAVAGTAVGCIVASIAARAMMAIIGLPPALTPRFTSAALAIAALLAVLSSVLFGFTPAIQSLRPVAERRLRLRNILMAVQVAAATVLLIVSGLLVRGVTRVVRVPLGFEYRQTLVTDPGLAAHGMKAPEAEAFWRDADARVRQIPGVANAALTTLAPFGNRVNITRGRTVIYHVTPSYFDTMRIPLLRGRLFAAGETGVRVVSASLARRLWPDADPLGQTYDEGTVVGVAADARTVRFSEGGATECYLPIGPSQLAEAVMVVRVEGAPRDTAATVQAVVRGDDARLTPSVLLLESALEAKLQTPRQVALIASVLGVSALLLAMIGIGGIVAFTVSQRLREIGVRVALGASPAHVVRAIGRQFAIPLAYGAAAGSGLAIGVGTILSAELFGVSRLDPASHGTALLLFAIVTTAAAAPSIRRALRVDPATTLRHE
jgi:predicted permease